MPYHIHFELVGSSTMVSAIDLTKRALVTLLRSLALAYNCNVDVHRDSQDEALRKAYRKVSRSVHPDRGGSEEDQKRLNAAHEAWSNALRARPVRGRPKAAAVIYLSIHLFIYIYICIYIYIFIDTYDSKG